VKLSEAFNLGKTQAELDFVDVDLARDAPLFIDPFAISQRLDSISQECHLSLQAFFQRIVDSIFDTRRARHGSAERHRSGLALR
jgi:hypothetical protein